jgi:hypothetical protein
MTMPVNVKTAHLTMLTARVRRVIFHGAPYADGVAFIDGVITGMKRVRKTFFIALRVSVKAAMAIWLSTSPHTSRDVLGI